MEVAAWLRSLGLEQYEQAFRDNAVDADILPWLTSNDLKELGVRAVGHRRKLLDAISRLDRSLAHPAIVSAEAERRQLTVMFCDLVGSTALASALDPEEYRAILNAYHQACTRTVAEFGGYVAKYMGDGVLAYFGYPQAHEDDAVRAVRAGLALTEEVAHVLVPSDVDPLRARVGIATGLVVVGDLIGAGAAQERSVVGETPNLAARLQALAPSGEVVIAPATRRLLGSGFDLRDLGPLALKGFSEPIVVWQVLGTRVLESRFETHDTRTAPLVGRGEELERLARRMDEAEGSFSKALEVARKQKARMWELRAACDLAGLWRDQGRGAEAYGLLAPVYSWFSEGFGTRDLQVARALLDTLSPSPAAV